jgi:hypothetical protein
MMCTSRSFKYDYVCRKNGEELHQFVLLSYVGIQVSMPVVDLVLIGIRLRKLKMSSVVSAVDLVRIGNTTESQDVTGLQVPVWHMNKYF